MNALQENCKAWEKKADNEKLGITGFLFSDIIPPAPPFFLDESASSVSLCTVFFEG
jgi:hypothetical protein